MPSFRIELYKGKELKDGYYPICITVTHKGKVKRKSIASATIAQWDAKNFKVKPKGRIDFQEVNDDIDDKYDKYKSIYKDLLSSGREWTPDEVFSEQIKASPMFIENSNAYMSTITKIFTKNNFKSKHDKFVRYAGDFALDKVNERWIAGYRHHCRTVERSNKAGTKGNSDNTINISIKYLKMVCNFAGVENQVLKKTKLSFKDTVLEYPDMNDFKKLCELKLEKGNRWHTRNIFSIQIYFRGMRIGDALQLEWSDIKDGRLEYDTGKTGHSHNIDIPPVALKIMGEYKGLDRKYIFPFFKWEYDKKLTKEENEIKKNRAIKSATSVVNNNLKKLSDNIGINRTITSHQARHMFAIWADEHLKGDLATVQRLLGHKDRAMTERYIKQLRQTKDLDSAALTVLSGIS